MAQAYKCDRCGVLYEPYEPYVDDKLMYNGHCVFMKLSPNGNIALCKSCLEQLINFLHGRPLQWLGIDLSGVGLKEGEPDDDTNA